MTKSAPAKVVLLLVFAFTACSVVVNADRSKVKDDLYQPSDSGSDASADDAGDASDADDGSADAGDAESMAGATGAAGASGEGGAAGAG